MERTGFTIPLLIGGATTSKAHTAVKIAPGYSHPVIHVLDASRAVPVVSNLVSVENKPLYVEQIRKEYDRLRAQHAGPKAKLIPLEEARKRRIAIEWKESDLPQPSFTGVRVLNNFPIKTLVDYIDWSPFFHTWELRGRYPQIFNHEKHGEEAKKLFADAQELLHRMVDKGLIEGRAVYGLFPANAVGDDVELYAGPDRKQVLTRFHFLRQQADKKAGEAEFSLSDFVAPKETGLKDHLGAFAVTSGHGLKELVEKFKKDNDDYNAIMAEALADRLAEAFAEYLHKRIREEWGYGKDENLSTEALIEEQYRGIRPAAGYPACPDHTEKATLWKLLDVEKNTGIQITENFAMWPGSSVSGLYFAHPQSKYFAVGKLDRDQILDYHLRKGMSLQEVERWLGTYLNYDPGTASSAAIGCACGRPH
jgi:5-methyltetrahydrofolate--homocysteine methyltransferase